MAEEGRVGVGQRLVDNTGTVLLALAEVESQRDTGFLV